jgi:RHS repeat-associated protein
MKYYHYGQLEDAVLTTDGTGQGIAVMPGQAEAGLRLYGPRLYDGWLGRFLMPDTIIPNLYEPQSHNPYSYCHNDPVNYIDPSGHYRRVPRIFPRGDMPTEAANATVGGIQLGGILLGLGIDMFVPGCVRRYRTAALIISLGINALAPTLLSPERKTMPRWYLMHRLAVDIMFHGAVAFGGFSLARFLGATGCIRIPLLVANSIMIGGGLWSSQVGGLMKSFGMGYNLGMLWPPTHVPGNRARVAALLERGADEYRASQLSQDALQAADADCTAQQSASPHRKHKRKKPKVASILSPLKTEQSDRSDYTEIPNSDIITLANCPIPDSGGQESDNIMMPLPFIPESGAAQSAMTASPLPLARAGALPSSLLQHEDDYHHGASQAADQQEISSPALSSITSTPASGTEASPAQWPRPLQMTFIPDGGESAAVTPAQQKAGGGLRLDGFWDVNNEYVKGGLIVNGLSKDNWKDILGLRQSACTLTVISDKQKAYTNYTHIEGTLIGADGRQYHCFIRQDRQGLDQ